MKNISFNARIIIIVLVAVNFVEAWVMFSGFAAIDRNEVKLFNDIYPFRLRVSEQINVLRAEMQAQFDDIRLNYSLAPKDGKDKGK